MLEAAVIHSYANAEQRKPGALLPLRVSGLRYGVGSLRILDGVDVTIEPGLCTVIMGYNGAGKSVLLRLLHGLLKPTAGSIQWAAEPPARQLRRRQAMVFQHPVLLRRTVANNLRYAMKHGGLNHAQREARLVTLLEESDLTHLARRPARVLSGGERQRVAVARALSIDPEILFLDEPTASLDPASTQAIERLIVRARDAGTKVVLVTQSIGQARRLGHDIVFLHRGRVAEHSDGGRFFNSPASAPARAFVDGRLPG